MKSTMIENRKSAEKVLLVMVVFKRVHSSWGFQQDLNEMRELVTTCGGEVVEHYRCTIDKPTAAYLIS